MTSTQDLTRRLWREHLGRYLSRLLFALVLMAIVAAVTGAYPLVLREAFDMFAAQDARVMWMIPPAVIALTITRGLVLYLQSVYTADIAMRVIRDMRNRLFRHLLGADLAQITAQSTAGLTSRFVHDVEQIREALVRVATNLVRDLLTVVALVGAMIYIDWLLALLVFTVYPIAAIPVVRIGKRLRRVSVDAQKSMGEISSTTQESLAGTRMVKTYGLENYEIDRAETVFSRQYRVALKTQKERMRLEPVMEILGGVAVAGVVVFAGWRMSSGETSVGDFTGFLTALLMAAQPVRAIGTLNGPLQQGLAAVERIFAVQDQPAQINDKPGAAPLTTGSGEIRLRNVGFHYDHGEDRPVALEGIDITLPAGKVTALVGPSGAGKSTLLNLIPRLYDVTEGTVEIDGQDVRNVTIASLRNSMALVSQDIVLFDDTVRTNIALGRLGATEDEIVAAAKAAAAHDFIEALEQGYDTPVGDRGTRLSGGQRQRIALARAILRNAPILLLDEATSALDAKSEAAVQAALEDLSHGRTSLVIAHRLATVRSADHIIVLDQGRVVEEGTHVDLIASDGLYARLCRMQTFAQDPEPRETGPSS